MAEQDEPDIENDLPDPVMLRRGNVYIPPAIAEEYQDIPDEISAPPPVIPEIILDNPLAKQTKTDVSELPINKLRIRKLIEFVILVILDMALIGVSALYVTCTYTYTPKNGTANVTTPHGEYYYQTAASLVPIISGAVMLPIDIAILCVLIFKHPVENCLALAINIVESVCGYPAIVCCLFIIPTAMWTMEDVKAEKTLSNCDNVGDFDTLMMYYGVSLAIVGGIIIVRVYRIFTYPRAPD